MGKLIKVEGSKTIYQLQEIIDVELKKRVGSLENNFIPTQHISAVTKG